MATATILSLSQTKTKTEFPSYVECEGIMMTSTHELEQPSEARLMHLNRLYVFLSQINQAIVRTRSRDELLDQVCRIAVEHGRFVMAWIGVPNPETGFIKPVAWSGQENGYLKIVRLYLPNETTGDLPAGALNVPSKTAHRVMNFISDNPQHLIPWRGEAVRRGYHSCAMLPIKLEDKFFGVFGVYASKPEFFDAETLQLLDEVASDISFALHTIDQEEQRRIAETEIRRLNQDLEKRVLERTCQLAEANRHLAAKNEELTRSSRMKSEFLARMSHEFRTPLNSIIGFSDLLEEQGEGPLGDTYIHYIRDVSEGAHHLLALVNDILDLSRIEAGRIDLHHEEFDPAEATLEVLSVTRPLAEAKQIGLRSEVSPALIAFGDRIRFKQVLYNLLSNAVKFTPAGGTVNVTAEPAYDEIRFCVSDTGIGIAREHQTAIFDEFTQITPAGNEMKEGTGLGLTITKRIVELHGGCIWVESSPGDGSRFFFTMPARYTGEQSSKRHSSSAA